MLGSQVVHLARKIIDTYEMFNIVEEKSGNTISRNH